MDLLLNLGYALLGPDLEVVEGVHVEVTDGVISHIGRGYVSEAADLRHGVAMPALVNAHLHVLDYAFLEYGAGLRLEEVVSEPHGLKHRLLSSLSGEDVAYACRRVFSKLLSSGVTVALVFLELPLTIQAVRSEAAALGVKAIVLSRPRGEVGVEEVVESADGLGLDSPLRFSVEELDKMKRLCRARGKLLATHVAESEEAYSRGDFELALSHLDVDLLVHGVHLKDKEAEAVAEGGRSLVACPRSNLWFRVGLPPIAKFLRHGVNVLLGTDNAGLLEPDMWRELEAAYSVARLEDPDVSAKEVLKAATVNIEKVRGLRVSCAIEEGGEANFIVLDAREIEAPRSRELYASIVKRGSAACVLKVVRGWSRE
ncbi:MAG: amidohydrolase family protein [Candidatus Nezhaarchaeota archaeon]|nr:amidohydrolase family protein [Candidatus Nezhaarchaeota archaeon]